MAFRREEWMCQWLLVTEDITNRTAEATLENANE